MNYKNNPDVVFIEKDTSSLGNSLKPYLSLYGDLILNQENFDNAVQRAINQDEIGYVVNILDCVIYDDFEIELPALYPN